MKSKKNINNINYELLEMANYLEQVLLKIIIVLEKPTDNVILEIKNIEEEIDHLEYSVRNKILKLLSTSQLEIPELRRIAAALNIIKDVERISDQCVNISEIIISSDFKEVINETFQIKEMINNCIAMAEKAIDAFIREDVNIAREVIEQDDEIDALFIYVKNDIVNLIKNDIENTYQYIEFMLVGKYLERIADHIVNIANGVIFSVTGENKKS